MVLKVVNWVHNTKIRSYGLERSHMVWNEWFGYTIQTSGQMVLKGVNWVHNDKIRSYGLERSNLCTQCKKSENLVLCMFGKCVKMHTFLENAWKCVHFQKNAWERPSPARVIFWFIELESFINGYMIILKNWLNNFICHLSWFKKFPPTHTHPLVSIREFSKPYELLFLEFESFIKGWMWIAYFSWPTPSHLCMAHLTPPLHDPPHPCMTHPTPQLHAHPILTPPHPSMTHLIPAWPTPPLHGPPHPCMTHPFPAWPIWPLSDPSHPCMNHPTPIGGALSVDMQCYGCFIILTYSLFINFLIIWLVGVIGWKVDKTACFCLQVLQQTCAGQNIKIVAVH